MKRGFLQIEFDDAGKCKVKLLGDLTSIEFCFALTLAKAKYDKIIAGDSSVSTQFKAKGFDERLTKN